MGIVIVFQPKWMECTQCECEGVDKRFEVVLAMRLPNVNVNPYLK